MKRTYFKKQDLEQKSPEWLTARMARFTSSEIWKLFTQATQEERIKESLKQIKEGKHQFVPFLPIEKSKSTSTLLTKFAKALELEEEEIKLAKKQIFEASDLDRAAQMIHRLNAVYNKIHVFSDGAKTYILEKANDLLYPTYEFKPMNAAMEWGEEHEAEALEAYKEVRKGFYLPNNISYVTLGKETASSPDELGIELFEKYEHEEGCSKMGVEVKCPSRLNHSKNILYIKNASDLFKIHPKYFYQCHHQIYVCDLDFVDWCSFHPVLYASNTKYQKKKGLHIVRVYRDESMIQKFKQVIPMAVELRNKYFEELIAD